MTQYLNISGKLKIIIEKPYKLEKEIQKLFEANLALMMDLAVVKSFASL